MTADGWLLVETLTEDLEPALVADDTRIREWIAPRRWSRAIGPAKAKLLLDAVRGRESARLGDTVVVVEPVRCALGGTHGVQVWIGQADAPVPPRRHVAAWDWDARTELAHHGPGLEELIFAREPGAVRVVRTPPEAFGRMVRFDGRVDYFAMASTLEPGGRWQGAVDVLGDDEQVRRFQMVARARPELRRVSGLMHAVPELGGETVDLEVAMLRAVSKGVDVGAGLILLASGVIYEWVADPPPPLDRWAVERPTIDPADLTALRAACAELVNAPETPRRLMLRVRFGGGEWIRAHAELATVTTAATGHGLLRVRPAVDGESG
ncbi:GAF domain-containing protein [Nocardia sp. GTS18]|uniref:GAF domain-containing protein n=1 Tax=Nocardia sp. GTS18 TaxID=1778064 RepID=UPI0015EE903D|nr:GAF domain-containing protein [Nocardia sp. GTS18]